MARIRPLRLMLAMLSSRCADCLEATWELAVRAGLLLGVQRPGPDREHDLAYRVHHEHPGHRAEPDRCGHPVPEAPGRHQPGAVAEHQDDRVVRLRPAPERRPEHQGGGHQLAERDQPAPRLVQPAALHRWRLGNRCLLGGLRSHVVHPPILARGSKYGPAWNMATMAATLSGNSTTASSRTAR